jgi:very-short-patch-repair endonuclease
MRSMVEGAHEVGKMRAPTRTIGVAQNLRRRMSPPEVRLWNRLRRREPGQPVFRRQHPVGPYVLDFYCASARLAVELDGVSHDLGDRPQRDLKRDAWLKAHGIEVVRIAVSDLPRNFDEVADSIVQMASEKR